MKVNAVKQLNVTIYKIFGLSDVFGTIFRVTFYLRQFQAALSVTLYPTECYELNNSKLARPTEDIQSMANLLNRLTRWHRRIGADVDQTVSVESKSLAAIQTCLPFLTIASWLKSFVFGLGEIPEVVSMDFIHKLSFLFLYNLHYFQADHSRFDTLKKFCLDSHSSESEVLSEELMDRWMEELVTGIKSKDTTLLDLIPLPGGPSYPRLVSLPQRFDMFFRQWSQTACSKCDQIPRDALVCLICGKLNCYKLSCCSLEKLSEMEMVTERTCLTP